MKPKGFRAAVKEAEGMVMDTKGFVPLHRRPAPKSPSSPVPPKEAEGMLISPSIKRKK